MVPLIDSNNNIPPIKSSESTIMSRHRLARFRGINDDAILLAEERPYYRVSRYIVVVTLGGISRSKYRRP